MQQVNEKKEEICTRQRHEFIWKEQSQRKILMKTEKKRKSLYKREKKVA